MKIKNISLLTLDDYKKYKSLMPNIKTWCWLLTPDAKNHDAVYYNENIVDNGLDGSTGYGTNNIRPVLWIDCESDEIIIGDEVFIGNWIWTAITSNDNTAFFVCNEAIYAKTFDIEKNGWLHSKLKLWLENTLMFFLKQEKIQKLKSLKLGDGKEILAPTIVDLSDLGALDEMEYELWHVIQQYMSTFGILIKEDEPDWFTVKQVQDEIIRQFEKAGVKFEFCKEKNSND